MAVYPQLSSGALAQFPVKKSDRLRTVVNTMADGSVIKLADPAAALTGWQLQYTSLSDAEAAALEQFFLSMEGSLNPFIFLDPTANLLAWSDQLTNDVWTADPFAGLTGGVADPLGGTNAWTLSNSGAAPQGIYQTLNAPGGYTYCLSVYLGSVAAAGAILVLGNNQTTVTVGNGWNRFVLSGQGNASANSIAFGVQVPPGMSLNLFGMQVEIQPGASQYKPSTQGGVYPRAYFRDDSLSFTSTDVNRNSVTVNIVYASTLQS
ncbi:MAG TPA: hypothetical protein VKV17_20680 [Bryobacteraceae bacterium]|nr:hypothetical protein [Bryobacteraceae bacterium]